MQRHFNLPKHVEYNPLHNFIREDVPHSNRNEAANSSQRFSSDLQILRAMNLHIPGVDSELKLRTSRPTNARRKCPYSKDITISGKTCSFLLTLDESIPDKVIVAVRLAIQIWADNFQCSFDPIRICFSWHNRIQSKTLGATVTPFVPLRFEKDGSQSGGLFTAALLASLEYKTQLGDDSYHIHMILNSGIPWHYETRTTAPRDRYDLTTAALHELTHGLYFSGNFNPDLIPTKRTPSRFDRFMTVEKNISVAMSCSSSEQLRNALTNPTLRFVDRGSRSDFSLYAPAIFNDGSSTYHFASKQSLWQDCDKLGIDRKDCSDLMTHRLPMGYTRRVLGEPTLRVYQALRSKAVGTAQGRVCDIRRAARRRQIGEKAKPFQLPLWGILTVAAVGGVGAIAVVLVVVSSVFEQHYTSESK